jgi:hypothetical protein
MEWVDVGLHGGPLDGQTITVDPADPEPGAAMMPPHSAYGPGGRSWCEPDEAGIWHWSGDSP